MHGVHSAVALDSTACKLVEGFLQALLVERQYLCIYRSAQHCFTRRKQAISRSSLLE